MMLQVVQATQIFINDGKNKHIELLINKGAIG